jgi:hypothetical protein
VIPSPSVSAQPFGKKRADDMNVLFIYLFIYGSLTDTVFASYFSALNVGYSLNNNLGMIRK